MLTKFGCFLRKLRINSALNLGELADRLSVRIPYLSALESGKVAIDDVLLFNIINTFKLNQSQIHEMYAAVLLTNPQTVITLDSLNDPVKQIIVLYTKCIKTNSLTELQQQQIETILNESSK